MRGRICFSKLNSRRIACLPASPNRIRAGRSRAYSFNSLAMASGFRSMIWSSSEEKIRVPSRCRLRSRKSEVSIAAPSSPASITHVCGEAVEISGAGRVEFRHLGDWGYDRIHLSVEAGEEVGRLNAMERDVLSIAQIDDAGVVVSNHMEMELRRIGKNPDDTGEHVISLFCSEL